jgi:hypothetical protein
MGLVIVIHKLTLCPLKEKRREKRREEKRRENVGKGSGRRYI